MSAHPARRAFGLAFAVALLCATPGIAPVAAAPGKGPDSVADVAAQVMDAVVNISTSQTVAASRSVPVPQLPPGSPFEDFFEEFFKHRKEDGDQNRSRRVSSLGSGFVISAEGLIVTNNHVIADADEIYANFNDGRKLKAELVGHDAKTDLALLKVTPDKPLTFVKFGNSGTLRVGDWVMAIGNPFGLGGTLTVGVVSALSRDINSGPYDNFIQTDAAINRGNSGGPLFNMQGEVVGINTAIISPSGGSIGIGFSVPSDTAKPIIAQLEQFKEVRRGWIGVRIQEVTDDLAESLGIGKARGALVGVVNDDSPAKRAGIKPGDVIVSFNGKDIKEVRDLTRTVADTMVETEVGVVVIRDGKEQALKLKVARMPDDAKAAAEQAKAQDDKKAAPKRALGMDLAPMSEELRRRFNIKTAVAGVVITHVDAGTAAADKGLKEGHVIIQVGQEAVSDPAMVESQLAGLRKQGKKSALLLVSDGEGQQQFITLPLD